MERTGANKKGSGYGGGDLNCMAEAQNTIICGYGGMECFGVLYDISTGKHLRTLKGLYGFGVVDISPDAKWVGYYVSGLNYISLLELSFNPQHIIFLY